MKPSHTFVVLVAVLLFSCAAVGAASATTNPKRLGGAGTITCFNDDTLQYSHSEVGPPLKSFSVENPCNTWMELYFARAAGIVDVIYVPPSTPAVTVSIDALRQVGLANLQYDNSGGGGSIFETSACSANLSGVPSFIVEGDGSLQAITC